MTLSDFNTVLLSVVISFFTSLIVALIIRYKITPKNEVIFEANRKNYLKFLFNDLDRHHEYSVFIFDEFEKKFGNLSRTRKELVKQIRFVPIDEIDKLERINFADIVKEKETLEELNKRLMFTFNNMKKIQNNFEKDFQLYAQFFHITLLQDIRQIYWQTNYYIECLFTANLVPSCLDSSKNCAEKIIKYIKEDKSLDKPESTVKHFIERWERELNQH